MKKIIHLSDLHFGTQREGLVEALVVAIHDIKPDIIVMSGDFTQRAKHAQYKQMTDFLSQLENIEILCVPGNHDISLYNLIERLLYPFRKYKKYICPLEYPSYSDNNLAILGLNSVTPYKVMSGYIADRQLQHTLDFFKNFPDSTFKIIVMHHNLIASKRHEIINDAEKIIQVFAKARINLILCGHIHYAYMELIRRSHISHNMYVITAGTAISTRTSEANSFNLIEFANNEFKLTVMEFDLGQFKMRSEQIITI